MSRMDLNTLAQQWRQAPREVMLLLGGGLLTASLALHPTPLPAETPPWAMPQPATTATAAQPRATGSPLSTSSMLMAQTTSVPATSGAPTGLFESEDPFATAGTQSRTASTSTQQGQEQRKPRPEPLTVSNYERQRPEDASRPAPLPVTAASGEVDHSPNRNRAFPPVTFGTESAQPAPLRSPNAGSDQPFQSDRFSTGVQHAVEKPAAETGVRGQDAAPREAAHPFMTPVPVKELQAGSIQTVSGDFGDDLDLKASPPPRMSPPESSIFAPEPELLEAREIPAPQSLPAVDDLNSLGLPQLDEPAKLPTPADSSPFGTPRNQSDYNPPTQPDIPAPLPSGHDPFGGSSAYERRPAAEPQRAATISEPAPARSATTQRVNSNSRPAERVHEVQPGENYWTISRQHFGTARYFAALAEYNKHRIPRPDRMKPGMFVLVPSAEVLEERFPKVAGIVDSKPSPESLLEPGFFIGPSGEPLYRIGKGDTLTDIAERHLGRTARWTQIVGMNREILKDGHSLKIGTVLRLPHDASQVALAPAGATFR